MKKECRANLWREYLKAGHTLRTKCRWLWGSFFSCSPVYLLPLQYHNSAHCEAAILHFATPLSVLMFHRKRLSRGCPSQKLLAFCLVFRMTLRIRFFLLGCCFSLIFSKFSGARVWAPDCLPLKSSLKMWLT